MITIWLSSFRAVEGKKNIRSRVLRRRRRELRLSMEKKGVKDACCIYSLDKISARNRICWNHLLDLQSQYCFDRKLHGLGGLGLLHFGA